MQHVAGYFSNHQIIFVILILIFEPIYSMVRNPFCFSHTRLSVPFSFTARGTIHNSSKSFAILNLKEEYEPNQHLVAKKGDIILGYKIIEILEDALIVHDDKNNEVIVNIK